MEKKIKMDIKTHLIKILKDEESGIAVNNFIQSATNDINSQAHLYSDVSKRKYIENEISLAIIKSLDVLAKQNMKIIDKMFANLKNEVNKKGD